MRSSNDLFNLIQSMTSQEKRYFKLHARSHSRNRSSGYVELFDAVDMMDEYQEDELKVRIAGQSFARHLSTYKYQLSNVILDSLAAFHRSSSVNAELRNMLGHTEILYNKGLYEHCSKLLARARRKAQEYEKYEILIELLSWERKLLLKNVGDDLESELAAHYDESKRTIEAAYNSRLYLELIDEVQSTCRRYARLRNPDDRETIEKALENPLLTDSDRASTFAAKVSRLSTLGFYEWIRGRLDLALEYQSAAIELWEEHPHHINDKLEWYKWYLTNYLTYCIGLKRFDDFEETVRKIKATPPRTHESVINMFESVVYLELTCYLNAGKIEAALVVAQECENGLEQLRDKIRPNRLMTLHHNCAILFFICEQFGRSLEHVNSILNHTRSEIKRDIQEFARVFRLLILYEMNLIEDLEHLFRSAKRYLSKHSDASALEYTTISALKRLMNAADQTELLRIFQRLHNELQQTLQEVHGKEPVGLIELILWVQSKIEQRTLREVYSATVARGS